jgi:hypothetical protein
MIDRKTIEMDLIKLAGGGRLLRLTEPQSGLSLEKKIDPKQPVVRQKQQMLGVFEAVLARAELMAS